MRIPPVAWLGTSIFVTAAIAATSGGVSDGAIRVPSDESPEVVRKLGVLNGVIALAVSDDRAQAAAVISDPKVRGRTRLRLAALSDPETTELELPGVGRSIVFTAGGTELLAIVSREIRKAGSETFLVSVEPDSLKATRRTNLPATAADLTLGPGGDLLFVASDNEVRTFRLPALSSGLVYVVPGGNRSIATVPGGSRILLGRDDGLFVVDLSDPQARDGMPVRERLALPGRVSRIAASPDGTEGLLRLDNGDVYRLELDPVRVEASGTAVAIAWPGERSATAHPPPSPQASGPVPAAAPPPVVANPSPAVVPSEPSRAAGSEEPSAPPVSGKGRLRGVISGPASDLGAVVVVLGPDDVLREAARVRPGADGAWVADGLEPGNYRVMLDAGGERQLVLDPPFRNARVEADRESVVADIKILRSL